MPVLNQEIRETIRVAAEEFADAVASSVLGILRGCTIEDLIGLAGGDAERAPRASGNGYRPRITARAASKKGKHPARARRTMEDIEALAERIAVAVGRTQSGATAEQIRETLGIERKELPRALREAIKMKLLTKRGQKRATTYFAGSKGAKKTKAALTSRGAKKYAPPKGEKTKKTMNGAAATA